VNKNDHLEVEFDVYGFLEQEEIAVLDVPAVFAEMDRDPIRTAQFRLHRGPNRIGFVSPAGLPNRGDVVDVDSQKRHSQLPVVKGFSSSRHARLLTWWVSAVDSRQLTIDETRFLIFEFGEIKNQNSSIIIRQSVFLIIREQLP
jgi:hypothetical protein